MKSKTELSVDGTPRYMPNLNASATYCLQDCMKDYTPIYDKKDIEEVYECDSGPKIFMIFVNESIDSGPKKLKTFLLSFMMFPLYKYVEHLKFKIMNSTMEHDLEIFDKNGNEVKMKEFIKKWSNWWILHSEHKQLDDAFEKELNELIEREAALRIHDVVGGREQFKCEKCGSDWGEVRATCFSCNHESEDLST